jgi:DNA-binding NarL/FixJ family response regulator
MKAIRLLLADDHRVLVESLAMMVDAMPGMEVVGTVHNGAEVLEWLEKKEVEIVLSDVHMPVLDGLGLVLQVRRRFPAVKVLLLTMSEEPESIREAVQAGAEGYILKSVSPGELEKAIRTVMSGEKYFSEDLLNRSEMVMGKDAAPAADTILSRREVEVMWYIINEVPTSEIAEKMFIAASTVETHRRNIFKKLDIHNVVGLARYAYKHGLLAK